MNHPKRIRYNGAVYARVDNIREAWQNEPTVGDPDAARELSLYVQTSSEPLYRLLMKQYYPPLLKRIERGTYDHDLALKHFLNFTEQAAKEYVRDHGVDLPWHVLFNKSTRLMVAKELRDLFEDSDEYRALRTSNVRTAQPELPPEYNIPVTAEDLDPEVILWFHGGQEDPVYALGSRLYAYGKTLASEEELDALINVVERLGHNEDTSEEETSRVDELLYSAHELKRKIPHEASTAPQKIYFRGAVYQLAT